ncbi:MAG: septal ring lytic transglycosylase RlpA family protein [Geminicoccaceae bacterium]|nr:septal ring lytic transglycosylase RlpA family protein [Geminicoccaceae bacterium]
MHRGRRILLAPLLLLAACSTRTPAPPSEPVPGAVGVYKLGRPYTINGRTYVPEYDPNYDRVGIASWYGEEFHGKPTANGEIFDKDRISAAHPTLPLPSRVRVTNLDNGRSIELRVNDRGPFVGDRLIDLSQAAARELGFEEAGLARVRVQFLRLDVAHGTPPEPTVRTARAETSAEPRAIPARAEASPSPNARATVREALSAPAPRLSPGVQLASLSAPARPLCPLGPHWVQLGVFTEETRWRAAVRTAALLDRPHSEPVLINGRAALRVRAGPTEDRGEALALAERARRLGFPDASVIPVEGKVVRSC